MGEASMKIESLSDESENNDFDRAFTCDLCSTSFYDLKSLKQHKKGRKHLKARRRLRLQEEFNEYLKNLNLEDDSEDENFTLKKVVAICEICDKEFNGNESYRLHLQSRSHKRKLEEMRLLEMAKEDGKINMEKLKKLLQAGKNSATGEASAELLDSDEDSYRCEDCDKVFSGLTPFRNHLVSKTHKKALKEKSLKEKLVADLEDGDAIDIDDDFIVCKICNKSFSGPSSLNAHLKGKNHANMVEFLEWKKEKKRFKNEQEKETESSVALFEVVESEDSDLAFHSAVM